MRARSIRNLFIMFIVACSSATSSYAQDASRVYIEPDGWSIGTTFGLADMWGDVGTKTLLDHYTNSKYFDKVTFMGGMYGRYTIHPALGIRFGLNYGTLFATDAWNYDKAKVQATQGTDAYQRYARQQKSKTNIIEGLLMAEFTPFRFNPETKWANRKGQLVLGLGVGYMHFDPMSNVGNGTKFVDIYDLHIEGDGFGDSFPKAYSLWQFVVPMSIGYRWDVGKHLNIGFEVTYRKTFTDYLDGVSGKYIDKADYVKHLSANEAQTAALVADKEYYNNLGQPNAAGNLRGNASNKDSYSTISFSIFYKILTKEGRWWQKF